MILNWKRQPEDVRDYKVAQHFKLTMAPLPVSVDLREYMSPVEDQGMLGSCTGNAIVGSLEYLENKQKLTFVDLSRLFIYYNERVVEGSVNEDSGAIIRDGIKSLVDNGVCLEKKCSYNIARFTKKPSKTAYKDALTRKITTYASVGQSAEEIRTVLASGYPIVFGFEVFKAFEDDIVTTTGIVPMPSGPSIGGHAVLLVGYDDRTNRFLVRNSWGANWGQKGYFTMPYNYVLDNKYADDFWVINK